jgi:hypothetical protein
MTTSAKMQCIPFHRESKNWDIPHSSWVHSAHRDRDCPHTIESFQPSGHLGTGPGVDYQTA